MSDVMFNHPLAAGSEIEALAAAVASGKLSGNGPFTRECQDMLASILGGGRVFLTHSCTAALEMSALLLDLRAGDEVIMPSFTFSSTANPFVLRGAVPVFVDVRPDTLNLDERRIEEAITPRTRAVCVIHYAGIGAEMDAICLLAGRRGITVIEDAAQALFAQYRGRPLGTFGQLAAFSFHETKNIVAGEGGALVVNDPRFAARAEILWEKGTNRADFVQGRVNHYTWVDVGSSFLPGELIAAFLREQLRHGSAITERRRAIWARYHAGFAALESAGKARRPVVPEGCAGNGHTYYLLLPDGAERDRVLDALKARGISAAFHYVPLHDSPAGRRFGRCGGGMEATERLAARLIRLPLHLGLNDADVDRVIAQTNLVLGAPHAAT